MKQLCIMWWGYNKKAGNRPFVFGVKRKDA